MINPLRPVLDLVAHDGPAVPAESVRADGRVVKAAGVQVGAGFPAGGRSQFRVRVVNHLDDSELPGRVGVRRRAAGNLVARDLRESGALREDFAGGLVPRDVVRVREVGDAVAVDAARPAAIMPPAVGVVDGQGRVGVGVGGAEDLAAGGTEAEVGGEVESLRGRVEVDQAATGPLTFGYRCNPGRCTRLGYRVCD